MNDANYAQSSLEAALEHYPRISLTRLPTPLQALPSLSARLGPHLFIKRDDLTDLALGGDKPRKLEYEVARAQAQGADTLVTCGSSQSNQRMITPIRTVAGSSKLAYRIITC